MSNDELEFGEDFKKFEQWYLNNPELIENLQTWLFHVYTDSEDSKNSQDVFIEVADMTVYLELFYLSHQQGNKYTITSTVTEMAQILETDDSVVLNALNSLQNHKALTFKEEGNHLTIKIRPIGMDSDHDHSHHHHDHHEDESHSDDS